MLPEDETVLPPPVLPEVAAVDVVEPEMLPVEAVLAVAPVEPALVEPELVVLPPVELAAALEAVLPVATVELVPELELELELELALWPVEAPEPVEAAADDEAEEDEELEWEPPEVAELVPEVEPLALVPLEPLLFGLPQPLSKQRKPARQVASRGAKALRLVIVAPRDGFRRQHSMSPNQGSICQTIQAENSRKAPEAAKRHPSALGEM